MASNCGLAIFILPKIFFSVIKSLGLLFSFPVQNVHKFSKLNSFVCIFPFLAGLSTLSLKFLPFFLFGVPPSPLPRISDFLQFWPVFLGVQWLVYLSSVEFLPPSQFSSLPPSLLWSSSKQSYFSNVLLGWLQLFFCLFLRVWSCLLELVYFLLHLMGSSFSLWWWLCPSVKSNQCSCLSLCSSWGWWCWCWCAWSWAWFELDIQLQLSWVG